MGSNVIVLAMVFVMIEGLPTTSPGELFVEATASATVELTVMTSDRVASRTKVLTVAVDDTGVPNTVSSRASPYIFLTLGVVTVVVATSL